MRATYPPEPATQAGEVRSLGEEADRLDLVAVGIADEGGVVMGVVVGAQAGRAGVDAAVGERDAVERVHLLAALGREADIDPGADAGRRAVDRLFEAETAH